MGTSTGGKPYHEQIALAQRWDKCVDAGSPITAQAMKCPHGKGFDCPTCWPKKEK